MLMQHDDTSFLLTQVSLSERKPVTLYLLLQYLLPAVLCFYTTAILVLFPKTFAIRLALLPLTLWFTFLATTSLDLAIGLPEQAFANQSFIVLMFSMALRVLVWTFTIHPYTRSTKNAPSLTSKQTWFDAFDLLFNLRGIGWSWYDQDLRIPKDSRDTKSTKRFISTTLRWLLRDFLILDLAVYTAQTSLINTGSDSLAVHIFDPTLTPVLRYTRSSIITAITGFMIYLGIEIHHYVMTIPAVLVFNQSPSLWPPVSDRPYLSTSLNQFWTLRWHQSFRDIFIQSSKPFAKLFGKPGGTLGVFLVSSILHIIGIWGLGRGTDIGGVSLFFMMNGVGMILERVYKSLTGKRVEGVVGMVWTYAWLVGWGGPLVNAWFLRGLVASKLWPEQISPAYHVHTLLSSFLSR